MPRGTFQGEPGDDAAPSELEKLSEKGVQIVGDELRILGSVQARLEREASEAPQQIEDLDAQLIELRDAIAEAKEEDVPSLIDQMHQVAALARKRGKGRSIPIDPKNPYFGHLRLREARSGRERDVLIGRHTKRRDVRTRRFQDLKIIGPLPWGLQMDGDVLPVPLPCPVTVKQKALRVLVPQKK